MGSACGLLADPPESAAPKEADADPSLGQLGASGAATSSVPEPVSVLTPLRPRDVGGTGVPSTSVPKSGRSGDAGAVSTEPAVPLTTVVTAPPPTLAEPVVPEPGPEPAPSTTLQVPEDRWCFALDLLALRGFEFAKSVRSQDAAARAGGIAGLQEVIEALLNNPPREVANNAAALATELNRVVMAANQGAGSEAEIRAAVAGRIGAVSPLVTELLAVSASACPRAEAPTVEAGEGFDIFSESGG